MLRFPDTFPQMPKDFTPRPMATRPKSAKPGQARAITKIVRAVKGGNTAHIQRAHRNAWPLWPSS